MAKSRALAVRLPLDTWDHLNEEARRKGLTLSTLARSKLMLTSEFDGPIQECIDDFAKRLGISRHEFIEAVLVDFMARLSIERHSRGTDRYHFLPQFVFTDRGLLRGRLLFEHMHSYYARGDGATEQKAGARLSPFATPSDDGPLYGADRSETVPEEPSTAGRSHECPAPAEGGDAASFPRAERARIEQAIFDRIMQHYAKERASEESKDGESHPRAHPE